MNDPREPRDFRILSLDGGGIMGTYSASVLSFLEQAANKDLEAKAKALNDPQTIKNTARGAYGMVEPGEEPYVVLPAPAGPTTLPQVWPALKRWS